MRKPLFVPYAAISKISGLSNGSPPVRNNYGRRHGGNFIDKLKTFPGRKLSRIRTAISRSPAVYAVQITTARHFQAIIRTLFTGPRWEELDLLFPLP